MPAKAAVLWTYRPRGQPEHPAIDECPSPVIAVGDRAWMGTADGAVVCVVTTDGSERWRFATGGRIWSAPSWAQGRIYAGSADGWLYCLSADSGALIWRFRVAPVESRIVQWDRLCSRWPVMPCTLVRDGVAYSLAGVVAELDGTEMVALDAATGTLRWEKRLGANQPDASGQMCWGDGAIWLRGGDWGNARVDPATGAFTQLSSTQGIGRPNHGQDIGYLGHGWLVYGGRQHILPGVEIVQDRMYCTYQLSAPSAARSPSILTLNAYKGDGISAWDDHGIVIGEESGHWWLDPDLVADLDASAISPGVAKFPVRDLNLEAASSAHLVALAAHSPNQAPKDCRFLWPMLSANQVILVGGGGSEWRWKPSVVAVDRASGQTAWVVPIPLGMPDWNGMCLDRAGQVLVPFLDGSLMCIGAPRP
jgi:outer membrane protein assembly factor BamB